MFVIRAMCPCGYSYVAAASPYEGSATRLAEAYRASKVEDWVASRRKVPQREIHYTVAEEIRA